jgi:predicted AlkP superfamily pyrophosphatase or phosphodiesterase
MLVLMILGLLASAFMTAQEAPRVLLISIDGLMPSMYTTPGPSRIPTLRRLTREGASARGVVGVLPSVTYPSHTTLITGVRPARHGIIDNRFVDPDNRSAGAWYWYARDIKTPTLITAARGAGLRTASIQWPVTVGAPADLLYPEYIRSSHVENLSLLRALATPNLLDAVETRRGAPIPWPHTDDQTADIAVFVAETYRPNLMLVHLIDLDDAEHESGPGSAAALETAERIDGLVDRIVTAFGGGNVLLAVASDHGFMALERTVHPNALFKQEGLLTLNARGNVSAWQAYFHSSGGSGYVYLNDPADEPLRSRVAALLSSFARDPANGVLRVWDAAALAERGAHPRAAFGIDMRNGFYSGSGHATLVEPSTSRGGHGFDPERPELHASLILHGGPFQGGGDLGIVRMTQIGPTLAAFLGVRLSEEADAPLSGAGPRSK